MLTDKWQKSTRSNADGQCVEAKTEANKVLIRDSKNKAGGSLVVSPEAWTAFVAFATGRDDA